MKTGFTRCNRGTVAVSLAVSLLPLLLGVGVAIDYSRYHLVRTAAQTALDNAVLAATAAGKDNYKNVFKSFFMEAVSGLDGNLADNAIALNASGSYESTVTFTVPMTFMRLAGIAELKGNLASAALPSEVEKMTDVIFETITAKGIYDKDFYFVTRDKSGAVKTRHLVLSYNWRGVGKKATFDPPKMEPFKMKVPEYDSWAVEMVVYADDSWNGKRTKPISHFSDDKDVEDWQKISGECDEKDGQSQSWEDRGDFDYADFRFKLYCTKVVEQKGEVRLAR